MPDSHPRFSEAASLTSEIISAAIDVHRSMGPGLLESIYEWCLLQELNLRGFDTSNQKTVIVRYKQFQREDTLRFDIAVNGCVLIEIKAVQEILPIHKAQLLSYMKLLDMPIGLLINFHKEKLRDGLSRLILAGAGDLTESQPYQ